MNKIVNHYIEKFLETKIIFYGDKVNTGFHDNRLLKDGSHCVCLSVILIDSVFKMDKIHYFQLFLEEGKYVLNEKKLIKYIDDELEVSTDEPDEEPSAKEAHDA